MTREVLSSKELAEYLGLGLSTVRKLTRNGELPYAKIGSKVRYKRSVIDRWLEARIAEQTESRQVQQWCEDKLSAAPAVEVAQKESTPQVGM